MGLQDLIAGAVSIAAAATADLQVEVLHTRWMGTKTNGSDVYEDLPTKRLALHERKTRVLRRTEQGEITSTSKLTFLDPISALGVPGRREPLDPRDRLVLPDGSSTTILDVQGLENPGTGQPFLLEVYLG